MKKVAILDTGVGASVDDFSRLHVKKSLDFTRDVFDEMNNGLDDNGHGTTCAKIIIKNANKSEIYSLKVLDKNRCGKISDLYAALQYLLTQEVNIINMSLAFSEGCYAEKIRIVCEKLAKQGKIIVASVGRYENRPFPASFMSVLGVQGEEFSSDEDFIYNPNAEIQITADDTPVFTEWKKDEIFILGGTSKAAALMSGKIAKWDNNIPQRLRAASGMHTKSKDKNSNFACTKDNTEYKKNLYNKGADVAPLRLGKHDYEKIINSLIRQFELQLPEYVSLSKTFYSIYTLEEFVRRYKI